VKTKRNERIGAIVKMLSDEPNRIHTLTEFGELFEAAKSTISEDIDIAQKILSDYGLGTLVTVPGAAGGVKYMASPSKKGTAELARKLCASLSDPGRILPGGYLYTMDILSDPALLRRMGEVIAAWFANSRADFVLTLETKGIPIAMMVAHFLGVPMVTARRDVNITDGSVVTINYVTGSGTRIKTMSLPKRTIKNERRALIVDDFMKGGGTAKGLMDMMKEFSVTVVGAGVLIDTLQPVRKLVTDYRSLMTLRSVDEAAGKIDIVPSRWVDEG